MAFLTLLTNIVGLSPVVFIRVSENELGDADLVITPVSAVNDSRFADQGFSNDPLSALRLVNISEVDTLLLPHKDIVGITPRWIMFGNISNPKEPERKISSMVTLVDPKRERSIGIGRNFDYPPLVENEAYVAESALRILNMYNDEDPDAVKNKPITFSIDVLGALAYGGNIAFQDSAQGEENNGMSSDVKGFINRTISELIPFEDTIEIWNETIRDDASVLIRNYVESLDTNNETELVENRRIFVRDL